MKSCFSGLSLYSIEMGFYQSELCCGPKEPPKNGSSVQINPFPNSGNKSGKEILAHVSPCEANIRIFFSVKLKTYRKIRSRCLGRWSSHQPWGFSGKVEMLH